VRFTPSARTVLNVAVVSTLLIAPGFAATSSPPAPVVQRTAVVDTHGNNDSPESADPPDTGDSSGSAATPAAGAGSYLLDDEFNGTSLDTSAWGVLNRGGDASNNEGQCYKPSNVGESGGYLQIQSKVDSSCKGYKYTSGMVQWQKFNFTEGTVEIRAKQSGGKGSWPAQWLLGADCQAANLTTDENHGSCNWPSSGSDEIDIAEFKSSGPSSVWQNVVSGDSGFKTCRPDVSDSSENWHVYSLTRHAGTLIWKVDGKTTCTQLHVVPSKPMFLIVNNAMGGDGGGQISASDFPQTMQVDYVRVTRV